jgi:hypothetical protein
MVSTCHTALVVQRSSWSCLKTLKSKALSGTDLPLGSTYLPAHRTGKES